MLKIFKYQDSLTVTLFLTLIAISGHGQESDSTIIKLKKLSMEELLNVEVISISMRPEKLKVVASAVQVITAEDIHRSGITRLPEALRLASNLQVAQANSHDWAITARGFNGLPSAGGVLANKLLVSIDGRSVYNPLFGGVYWDAQYALTDIDRIEVVSGPGGTLWGANAVNGVINVVSKSAKETQGVHVAVAGGSFLRDLAEARYGFKSGKKLFARVWGRHLDQRSTSSLSGEDVKDDWTATQAGFRMDYFPSDASTLTVQGDFYNIEENEDSLTRHATIDGQNLLARYTNQFSEESNLFIQAYVDRNWRITPNSTAKFYYELYTYDLEIQYRLPIGERQSLLVGGAYRMRKDYTVQSLHPPSRSMPLYSGFIQDEIILAKSLKLTLGSKFLHNVFSGFEIQPCARLAWTTNDRYTLWTSVSRAVRTPSRFDSDVVVTDKKFDSEKVIAYELGYRFRPFEKLSLSLATFFNHYSDLRSLDANSNPPPPILLANSQKAESWGIELSGSFQATAWWRLRGGYTYMDKTVWATNSQVLPISEEFEGVDPKNIAMLQSIMDLPKNFQLDIIGRYASKLRAVPLTVPIPEVPEYVTFDLRLAWHYKSLELSLVGQNLLKDEHSEVGNSTISRSYYGKIMFQL